MPVQISPDDVAVLRAWINQQEHLPGDKVDDHLVARFLHCCNNNIETCKSVMELFFKLRAEVPEFFTDRDPLQSSFKDISNTVDMVPLPNLTPEGYQLCFFRLSDTDPNKFNYLEYLKMFFDIADTRIKLDKEFPNGEVPIFDMTGFTFRHIMKINLSYIRKYMHYIQDAHPVQLKQVHVINTLPILERLMIIIRPLLRKQVAEMLHFHVPNSNTLDKFVPKHLLPNEYGGQAGPIKELKQNWMNKVESEREWLMSNPWHALETKTTKKNNKKQTIEHTNFKSLSID